MARVKEEARKKYFERISPYRKSINELRDKERRIEAVLKGNDAGDPYKRLSLANDNLTAASYHLVMNSLSVSLLGVKNESALIDGKKSCSLAIIQLEKVFTDLVDVPFGDYEENLKATTSFNEMKRYDLIRKAGLALSMVKISFGENTRWKWPMVDLDARLAAIAKNCLDLKTLVQGMDPRSEGYRERIEFFNLSRKMLQDSADGYRMKYEVSTKRADDFRKAISFLGALQRLSMLLGRQNEAIKLKKKIDIWKKKMESDSKNREDASRLSRIGGPSKN
ncbi:MAG: hypothetical protein KAH21_02020 [Spirochaetaceae bacterium]|nr:hypothetical protein [Spirochaetaceae bacterium]